MSNKRYAIIIEETGVVHNVCEWDGNLSTWRPDPGMIAVQTDDAARGMIYKGGKFLPAPAPASSEKEPIEALADLLVEKSIITAEEARPITRKEGEAKNGALRNNH